MNLRIEVKYSLHTENIIYYILSNIKSFNIFLYLLHSHRFAY